MLREKTNRIRSECKNITSPFVLHIFFNRTSRLVVFTQFKFISCLLSTFWCFIFRSAKFALSSCIVFSFVILFDFTSTISIQDLVFPLRFFLHWKISSFHQIHQRRLFDWSWRRWTRVCIKNILKWRKFNGYILFWCSLFCLFGFWNPLI